MIREGEAAIVASLWPAPSRLTGQERDERT